MKVYVVMKQSYSPVAITSAHPHEVFVSKKQAMDRAKELDKKATKNHYWVEPAEMEAAK